MSLSDVYPCVLHVKDTILTAVSCFGVCLGKFFFPPCWWHDAEFVRWQSSSLYLMWDITGNLGICLSDVCLLNLLTRWFPTFSVRCALTAASDEPKERLITTSCQVPNVFPGYELTLDTVSLWRSWTMETFIHFPFPIFHHDYLNNIFWFSIIIILVSHWIRYHACCSLFSTS